MVLLQALPSVEVGSQDSQPPVIEVVAERSGQEQSIDRRTFRVQQNPSVVQKDGAQLLRGLPSVTMSADDEIRLLGSNNVRIYVDGRPYPGDAQKFLRTLHGGDIDTIDVIANPSAQFSADGSGGIINFNLLKKVAEGASGNILAEGSTIGRVRVDGAYKEKKGDITYEYEAHLARGVGSKSSSVEQYSEIGAENAINDSVQIGSLVKNEQIVELVGKVTYAPDKKTTFTAKIDAARFQGTTKSISSFQDIGITAEPATGRWLVDQSSTTMIGEVNLDHRGDKDDETLRATIRAYGKPDTSEKSVTTLDDETLIDADRRQSLIGVFGQIDWQKPAGKKRLLSVGASWNYRKLKEDYTLYTSDVPNPQIFNDFEASNETVAGYATFQQPIGGWKVMPGMRVEHDVRQISFPGTPTALVARTNLFPTFHLEHRLSKRLNMTLSYSRRIDRAPAEILRPYLVVENIVTGAQGNPNLKDQSTDSYEASLHYNHGKLDANVTLFDRDTRHLWSRDYSYVGDIYVYSWVNSGERRSFGFQFDMNTSIVKRLTGNFSVAVFEERAPIGVSNPEISYNNIRYTFNGSLEWRRRDRGKISGDDAELGFTCSSAYRDFQTWQRPLNRLNASYTHSFTPSIATTISGDYGFADRRYIFSPAIQEQSSEKKPFEVRFKILKRFGGK